MIDNMGIYIEALILYIILFLAGSAGAIGNIPAEVAEFSAFAELNRIILYSIPSLALVWYLLLKGKIPKNMGIKPCKNDIISGLIAFPCLFITGFATALISQNIGPSPQVPAGFPSSVIDWTVVGISCILAAYLEESFFRYYLISKRKELNMGQVQVLIFSTLLFSVCHIYEGPWGFLNSIISGVILAFLFLRYQTLHGIAIAHGLYNIAVYVINSILIKSL